MKKHITFLVGFILLSSLFLFLIQMLSGVYLTSTYTPNINEAWKASANLSQEVEILSSAGSFLFTLLAISLAAVVAYFVSHKFIKRVYN